jgi:NitT/TauT family transport system substrate-binding protein
VGTINAGMMVTRKAIRDNPALVQRLVSSHARATDHLKSIPAEWLKKASAFGTPLRVLERALPNMELAWKMDTVFLRRARALGERMQALGLIEKQPDYDELFNMSFVAKVPD